MQMKAMKQPNNPQQLVDKICKHFLANMERNNRKYRPINFKATQILKSKSQMEDPFLAKVNVYPIMREEAKINDKVNYFANQISQPSKTQAKLEDLR